MEYVYAALLLHKLGKKINDESLSKVISSTGVEVDDGKVKLLSNALKDVDIDKELENALTLASGPMQTSAGERREEKKEEKKEEVNAAAEGLSSLFG